MDQDGFDALCFFHNFFFSHMSSIIYHGSTSTKMPKLRVSGKIASEQQFAYPKQEYTDTISTSDSDINPVNDANNNDHPENEPPSSHSQQRGSRLQRCEKGHEQHEQICCVKNECVWFKGYNKTNKFTYPHCPHFETVNAEMTNPILFLNQVIFKLAGIALIFFTDITKSFIVSPAPFSDSALLSNERIAFQGWGMAIFFASSLVAAVRFATEEPKIKTRITCLLGLFWILFVLNKFYGLYSDSVGPYHTLPIILLGAIMAVKTTQPLVQSLCCPQTKQLEKTKKSNKRL